jgi:F0F1-type ATP synthase epsilon subunit
MILEIIRPTKKEVLEIEWVELQSPTGNFVVGPNHSPLVSILKERGKMLYKKVQSEKTESVDIYGGVFKVQNDHGIVILDI